MEKEPTRLHTDPRVDCSEKQHKPPEVLVDIYWLNGVPSCVFCKQALETTLRA